MRERLAEGQPSQAILDGWPVLESAADLEPEALAAALAEAARLDERTGAAALAPASAVNGAVVNAAGRLLHADPGFVALFGRTVDSLAFRRLVRLALREGQAAGLAEARDGSVIAVSAGTPAAAAGWPLSTDSRISLDGPGGRVALLAFAPSRASDLAMLAAQAFGLTPLEARLAEALLDSPNLMSAAARIGVGRETARDALRGAMKKAGARRSPDLVRRMMDLMCGDHPPSADLEKTLRTAFDATPAEARAAARFADGLTAKQVAAALGVKEATVRGQLKAVFAKTGVNKAKDLVRLCVEAGALAALTQMSEAVVDGGDTAGRLRIVRAAGDRRIAFIDYGPRSGRPIFVLHGQSTGRTLPPRFAALLQAQGWRPIVPQRPGFGLTDRAHADHLTTCADDMAAILDTLKLPKVDLLGRDAAVAPTLAFAERHPDRVRAGALINAHAPAAADEGQHTLRAAVLRTFISQPHLIETFAEMLRRQTRTDLLVTMIRQTLEEVENDRRALDDPAILRQLVRDAQALSARSSAGFAVEQSLYARGWAAPTRVGGERWKVFYGHALGSPDREKRWAYLPAVSFHDHADAGLLVYFTYPEVVAELLGPA
ncbi:MAG: alpha/beta fold hydrolase [Proteobacteria bacterium]|nr:alpha/beta fold hydrolase [Pseudomonadota bacterium]